MYKKITRGDLIKISAKAAIFFSFISLTAKNLFAGLAIKKHRAESVYEQDRIMPLRKSQDNPAIKAIYRDFLEHVNSHKAHELLHTEYVDRSSGIKKLKSSGIKLNF